MKINGICLLEERSFLLFGKTFQSKIHRPSKEKDRRWSQRQGEKGKSKKLKGKAAELGENVMKYKGSNQ